MTTPRKFRRRITASAGDSDTHATERAALLGLDCPKDGNPFLHILVGLQVHEGRETGRAVWERHRVEICIDPHRPGVRPPAFWVFDCNTLPDVPEIFRTGVDGSTEREPTQEEQARWLHAHGMLTAAERKKLPKAWFAPSPPTLKVVVT